MTEKSLYDLDGKKLNDLSIKIGEISAGKYPEAVNFELYLMNQKGKYCNKPVAWGVFFGGRGEIYKPWVEIYFREEITFGSYVFSSALLLTFLCMGPILFASRWPALS